MFALIKQLRTSPRAATEDYYSFVAANCGSEVTVATYRQRLNGFIGFLEELGVKNVRAIEPGHIDRWVARLKRQSVRYAVGNSDHPPERGKLSPATIAGRVQSVKRFCDWCEQRFDLESSPAAHLKVRRPKPRPADQAMRYDELLRLIRYARLRAQYGQSPEDVRYMAMLAFLVDTMCRRGEAASLQLSSIALDTPQQVTIQRGEKIVTIDGYAANVTGKTGPRTVWFTEFTAEPLRTYLAIRPMPRHRPPHDYVWVGFSDRSYGLPLTPEGIYQAHKAVTKAIGLNGPSGLHAIRHCMATYWARHIALDQLQKKLGHADITTTMGYVATDDRDVIKATDELSPLRYTDHETAAIMGNAAV